MRKIHAIYILLLALPVSSFATGCGHFNGGLNNCKKSKSCQASAAKCIKNHAAIDNFKPYPFYYCVDSQCEGGCGLGGRVFWNFC